jgi:hypothetical protein
MINARLQPCSYRLGSACRGFSVLILDRASVPVDLQPLHKRIIDRDDVGGNRPIIALELSELQPLVLEALELQSEIAVPPPRQPY